MKGDFVFFFFSPKSGYFCQRNDGVWVIYSPNGVPVAEGLNQQEMENYMKLLTEK